MRWLPILLVASLVLAGCTVLDEGGYAEQHLDEVTAAQLVEGNDTHPLDPGSRTFEEVAREGLWAIHLVHKVHHGAWTGEDARDARRFLNGSGAVHLTFAANNTLTMPNYPEKRDAPIRHAYLLLDHRNEETVGDVFLCDGGLERCELYETTRSFERLRAALQQPAP